MITKTQKEAKKAADKYVKEEGKRRFGEGYKLSGMSAYTVWTLAYSEYIYKAGYKFFNGQIVLR